MAANFLTSSYNNKSFASQVNYTCMYSTGLHMHEGTFYNEFEAGV